MTDRTRRLLALLLPIVVAIALVAFAWLSWRWFRP